MPYSAVVKKELLITALRTRGAKKAKKCVSAVAEKWAILLALHSLPLRRCFCFRFVAFLEDEQREYGDKQL